MESLLDKEWLLHKEEIGRLYVDQNWKLNAVMRHMEENRGFRATDQMYKKRFRKWGMSKSLKKAQWESVVKTIARRKRDGKDTAVCINGVVVSSKKLQTAVTRYYNAQSARQGADNMQQPPVSTVTIRTPPPASPALSATAMAAGDMAILPWDGPNDAGRRDTESFVESMAASPMLLGEEPDGQDGVGVNALDTGSVESQVVNMAMQFSAVSDDDDTPPSPSCLIDWRFHKSRNLPFFRLQNDLHDLGLPQFSHGSVLDLLVEGPFLLPTPADPLTQLQLHLPDTSLTARAVVSIHRRLFEVLFSEEPLGLEQACESYNIALVETPTDVHSCLVTAMKGFIPEQYDGDLQAKATNLMDPARAAFQLLEIIIYITSNHLEGGAGIRQLIALLRVRKLRPQILAFLDIQSESVQSITNDTIDEAIRQDEVDIIRDLHVRGFEFDDKRIATCCCRTKDMSLVARLLRARTAKPLAMRMWHPVACDMLLRLVRDGPVDVIRMAIEIGADPGCKNCAYTCETPLFEAVLRGDHDILRLLLDEGAWSLVNHTTRFYEDRGKNYRLPLTLALSLQDYASASILRDYGADETSCPPSPRSCERKADREPPRPLPRSSRISSVEYSLSTDEDLAVAASKADDPWEWDISTPLQVAVGAGDVLEATILLSAGADPDDRSSIWSPTALFIATSAFDLPLVQLLLSHGADANKPVCVEGPEWSVPLMVIAPPGCRPEEFAANGGDAIVQLLIAAGGDINGPPPALRAAISARPLHRLVACASLDTIKVALDAGAELHHTACSQDNFDTPLKIACCYRDADVVQLLLERGADVNESSPSARGPTALQAAFCRNTLSLEVVELLLRHGADINAAPKSGARFTALQAAAQQAGSCVPLVELLLDYGADVNAKPYHKSGLTALQAAAGRTVPCVPLVELLLMYGADVNARPCYSGGLTALQAVAESGHVPIAQLLLEAGADPNAPAAAEDGCDAVETAAIYGRLDMVQLLLDSDAVGDVAGWQLLKPAIKRAAGHGPITKILQRRQEELEAMGFEEVLKLIDRARGG